MATSSRFAIAVHMLAYISIRGEGLAVPSERIALSVNTNPAVVRKILTQLAAAGLTTSKLGTGGGALLARPAESITLLAIHDAVQQMEVFGTHRSQPNPKCLVGRNISAVIQDVSLEVEATVRAILQKKTLKEIADEVLAAEGKRQKR